MCVCAERKPAEILILTFLITLYDVTMISVPKHILLHRLHIKACLLARFLDFTFAYYDEDTLSRPPAPAKPLSCIKTGLQVWRV